MYIVQSLLSRSEEALDSLDAFTDDFALSMVLTAWKEKSSSPTNPFTSLNLVSISFKFIENSGLPQQSIHIAHDTPSRDLKHRESRKARLCHVSDT